MQKHKNLELMKTLLMLGTILLGTVGLSQAQSDEEAKVGVAVETFRKAVVDADKATLEKILDEGLTYGHSGGSLESKAHLIETLMNGDSDFKTMDLTEQTIKIFGKTAVVRHKLYAETNNRGVAGTVKLGILLVFQKTKNDWKLIARQAVKI